MTRDIHPKSILERVVSGDQVYWKCPATFCDGTQGYLFLNERCPVSRKLVASYQHTLYLESAHEHHRGMQGARSVETELHDEGCYERAEADRKQAEAWRRWGLGKD